VLISVAIVLLGCIGLVQWWPIILQAPAHLEPVERRETVELTRVEPTVQGPEQPPPPPPEVQAPPVEVPDDVVLPVEQLDLSLPQDLPPADGGSRGETAGDDAVSSTGEAVSGRPPKPVRLVEPRYTSAARAEGIRARIIVEVLVNEKGEVEEGRIVQRYVLDEEGRILRPVDRIGYGLEEAALSAAQEWRFRPGRRDGIAVSAYTRVTFSFGF
jgi:protein TonB